MNIKIIQISVLILATVLMTSCGIVQRFSSEDDYAQAGSQGNLEAPPELVTPEWKDSLKIPQTGSDRVSALETYGKAIDASVAPEFVDISIRREGDMRWLEAEVDPVNLWPLLRSFWADQGIVLERDKPTIGVMETDWIEDIDSSDNELTQIREFTATRSKFKIRIEREPNAVTNIYVSQRRTELQNITEQGGVWVEINSDPETEAEMLVSLMEHMGQSRESALFEVANVQGPRLYIELRDLDGIPVLYVGDQYSRVWRRTGIALDRTGLEIYDQNRSQGMYLIDVKADELTADADISAGKYQIHLLSQGAQTLLTVHAAEDNGEVIPPQTARLILSQIVRAYQVFRTTG